MILGCLNYFGVDAPPLSRHPELVSGSNLHRVRWPYQERWMLKRVQHDGLMGVGV